MEQQWFELFTKLFHQRNWRLSALLKGTLTLVVEGFGVFASHLSESLFCDF